MKESLRHLGLGVSDLHERLRVQQDRLAYVREKRQSRSTDKTQDELRLEKHVADFAAQVDELTGEAEQYVRDIIDYRAEQEDQTAILGDLYTQAVTEHSETLPSRTTRSRQDEEMPTEDRKEAVPSSTVDAFRAARAEKHAAYTTMRPHERYALNNDYAGFKKLWHDAAVGEDGPPLADASRWFRPDGRPVMKRPGARRMTDYGDEEDEEDDDIEVARETLSLNCPLTLRPMTEPYSNVKCKHTFEKTAILEYLPARGEVQCPQTGCAQKFARSRFETEFYLDEAMLRRIERTNRTRTHAALDDMDADGGDEGDESLVVERERNIKRERRR